MIEICKKVWILLTSNERKQLFFLLGAMIIMSCLEVLGVGSIMPFLAVLGNPETIHSNIYLLKVYDSLGYTTTESFLIFLGFFALIMLIISAVSKSIISFAQFKFTNMRRHSIGQKLLKKYLQQPYSFFLFRNSSDISKVILSETDLVIGHALEPLLKLLTYSILSLFLIVFLIIMDPILAIILAGIFGLFYVGMYLFIRNYLEKIGGLRSKANTDRFKIVSETIGGIKDLKVLGRENMYLDSFDKPSYEYSIYSTYQKTISQIPQFLIEVIVFGALLSMSMYALVSNGTDTESFLPILGLYALGALKLKPAVNSIYSSLTTMRFGVSAIDNVLNDLENSNELTHIKNNSKRMTLKKALNLKSVSFCYNGIQKKALQNINIEVRANTTVGIIGTTGAGKSTLIDIILGLLEPISGSIEVDNQLLTKEKIREWQNSIGYVPQNIFLADETIASNIAFGMIKKEIDYKQVAYVAKLAQVDGFVSKLEHGYDTVIGERGVRLSGGQRQRLGIARALYHNPELLILDEATSALDNRTEEDVMQAINNMSGSKTIIIIAHRLSTIKKCDKVYKIENGEIKHV